MQNARLQEIPPTLNVVLKASFHLVVTVVKVTNVMDYVHRS